MNVQKPFSISDVMNEAECKKLQALLENQEKEPIAIHRGIRELWFHNEAWDSELRLLFMGTYQVTVSRVAFIHRRHGTMTKVLAFLEDFCRQHQIQRILIQSVETPEMAAFCQKNGFEPRPNASFEMHGYILGDHIKEIR